MSKLKSVVANEAYHWGNNAERYFQAAEKDMSNQWQSMIAPFLKQFPIDYSRTLDLAVGRGRNTHKILQQGADAVLAVDVNEENLTYCKKRFSNDDRVNFIHCDGCSLPDVKKDDVTFFYCFDAMVHFDIEIIIPYVKEIFRVLTPGGHAFLHHSNLTTFPGRNFVENPHWRNFNSKELMAHLAIRNGLTVAGQKLIDWGDCPQLDCFTMLQKDLSTGQ